MKTSSEYLIHYSFYFVYALNMLTVSCGLHLDNLREAFDCLITDTRSCTIAQQLFHLG